MRFQIKIPPLPPELSEVALRKRAGDAMDMIAEDAIALLAEATPVGVFGHAQGGWQKAGSTTVTMTDAVVTVENMQPYLYYVVHGTTPARRNPGGFIIPWVDKKLSMAAQYKIARRAGMSEKQARSAAERSSVKFQANALTVAVAFIIGRARMRRGSEGNDFVTEISEQNEQYWAGILQKVVFS